MRQSISHVMSADYYRFTVHQECNSHCACATNRKSYDLVCGSDNLTYFSACFAGCTDLVNDVSINQSISRLVLEPPQGHLITSPLAGVRSIMMSISFFVCLSVCLSVCLLA